MQGRPILVIDDDASTIKHITGTLQPMGYSIITAANGDEGLGMAKSQSPSIIFINLAVPGTDGLKICKAFMDIINVPIVLLTMREGKYDPRYKSQYGIVDFLKKPVNAQELIAKVDDFAHHTSVVAAEDAEDEDVGAIEIAEDEAPSASELVASVASYAEAEEPPTPLEEAVSAVPDENVAEAVEIIEEVSDEDVVEAAEIEATEETLDDEEEGIGEWSIPEEEAPTSEESPAFEETSALEDSPSADEATTANEMDWDDRGESQMDESFNHGDASEDTALQDEDTFDGDSPEDEFREEDSPAFGDEGPYELPPVDEKEYEVRPAALERAKRRKSKSRVLIPVIALVLVIAAAAFFVFFSDNDIFAPVKNIFTSGKDSIAKSAPGKPVPERPAPAVAKKTEPTPTPDKLSPAAAKKPLPPPPPAADKPLSLPPPPEPVAKKSPPSAPVAKKPVPPQPAPAAKKPSPVKTAADKTYYVQFGAFRSRDNAVKFQKELKDLGYDTFIKETTSKDASLNLVLLSDKFSDKWTAFKQARQIKETSDIGTAVHME